MPIGFETVLKDYYSGRSRLLKRIVFWIAFLGLIILHHDWWFWSDERLLFGFLPIGLGYHALISLAAGGLWAWAAFYALSEYFSDDEASDFATTNKGT